ncbi:unnamed protein product [Enterobius vermicularis]|uniref:Cyclic nucleotide-binding domain-containing protein n=1 Tax=Enterobius vermicularis TaxID=51028 RepID=A0A3P6HH42_ENTVE|nr:unnamed protein product [Enterobius vermicularis]
MSKFDLYSGEDNNFFRSLLLGPVDPTSTIYLFWLAATAFATFYNTIAVVAFIFDDIRYNLFYHWLCCNAVCDLIYLFDIYVQARKGSLNNGEVEKDVKKTAKCYFKRYPNLMPTDLLLLLFSNVSLSRLNRLFKFYRLWEFAERAQMRTQWPNSFKIFSLIVLCLILFHWNACAYFYISLITDIDINGKKQQRISLFRSHLFLFLISSVVFEKGDTKIGKKLSRELVFSNFSKEYSLSFYWSSLTLTTKGQQPYPTDSEQNWLEIIDTLIGLLVFATIVGSVGAVVLMMSRKQAEFQQLLDGIKFYMNYRNVTPEIQKRVINCCEYVRDQNIISQTENIIETLPTRLQGELAVQLHLQTLNLVQDCEAGLLYELLLRLRYQLYSPGDLLCKRGDLAREMYIIERGRLNCVSDDGGEIYRVLEAGDVFGQLAILNLSGDISGNRREVALCAAAYTDIYSLHQDDAMEVLQDYPEERRKLIKREDYLILSEMLLCNKFKKQEKKATVTNAFAGIELLKFERLYDPVLADHRTDEWKMLCREEQLIEVGKFLDEIEKGLDDLYQDFNVKNF